MDIISYALAKSGIPKAVSDYLGEHLNNPTNPPIDTSLKVAGAAADAKTVGDMINSMRFSINDKGELIYQIGGE